MNIKYFEIAKKIASTIDRKCSDGRRNKAKMVAVLIPRVGNEVFIGTNKMDKTHAASPHPWKTIHAELDALLKVGRGYVNQQKIVDADIYVYRESSLGQANAKPCKYCFNMLIEKGIKNIFYSDQDGFYSYTKGKIHD